MKRLELSGSGQNFSVRPGEEGKVFRKKLTGETRTTGRNRYRESAGKA